MKIQRWAIAPLRAALVVLFGILVVLQTFSLPGQFRHMAQENPQDAGWRWPLTLIAVLCVVCAQVVVVATWKLLGLIRVDRIFSPAAFVWVDAILGAVATGWMVLLGIFLAVGFTADDPGAPMLLFLLTVAGAVVGLVLVVMRSLLQQATDLRSDLEAVI